VIVAITVARVTLSLFAVFGLYAAVRLLLLGRLPYGERAVVIEVREALEPEALCVLVVGACESFVLERRGSVILLLEATLDNCRELCLAAEQAGAKCYLVTFEGRK